MEQTEKRKAGDYEIIQSFHIGDREIVIGENPLASEDEQYMCAYCRKNELFAQYSEMMVSDDYCEIVKLFADRLSTQAGKTRVEVFTPKFQGIDTTPLTRNDCNVISRNDDINNKIIILKPEVLRREYRMSTNQIKLCNGGFGAYPNSRGSACFCIDLYSGEKERQERMDILGTIEPDQLPQWAKLGLERYQTEERMKKTKSKEAR